MNLKEVRSALVNSLSGLGYYGYTSPPSVPELPCVYVGFPIEMREFSLDGSSCVLDIPLTVAFSLADEATAQDQMSEAIGDGQILSALLAAPTEFWWEISVSSITNVRATTFGETNVLAADISLSIQTR